MHYSLSCYKSYFTKASRHLNEHSLYSLIDIRIFIISCMKPFLRNSRQRKILTYDCYEGMDILTTDRLFLVLKLNRGLLAFLLLVTAEINRTVQNFNQGYSA